MKHRLPRALSPQIGGMVGGAEEQGAEPRRRLRDRCCLGDATGALDQGDKLVSLPASDEQPVHQTQDIGRLGLRHHDGVGLRRRPDQAQQVFQTPGRAGLVDPHRAQNAVTLPRHGQPVERRLTGRRLVGGATASSRSMIRASAPAPAARSKRSGLVAGVNSQLLLPATWTVAPVA